METDQIFNSLHKECLTLFEKKTRDYGTAWRILRLPSLTDQIYIKAVRVRTLQEKGVQKVVEGQEEEFVAIMNYCIMALMQMQLTADAPMELPLPTALEMYEQQARRTQQLLMNKNHDYGEAWRQMRVPGITDIILMKLIRIRQIEANQGQTLVSEGVEGGYQDIYNYAAFCLAHLRGWVAG